jgi:hypothetical protein
MGDLDDVKRGSTLRLRDVDSCMNQVSLIRGERVNQADVEVRMLGDGFSDSHGSAAF